MFLIRCSILNYVNADIEESQYYIIPGFKKSTLLPYRIPDYEKKKRFHAILVEVYSHCKGWHLALSSARDQDKEGKADKTIQAPKYKAINCYGSVGGKKKNISINIYIMLLEIIQAHDFVQLFLLISQWEDLYVQLHTQSGTRRTCQPVIPPFWAVSFKFKERLVLVFYTSASFRFVSKHGRKKKQPHQHILPTKLNHSALQD